MRSTGDVFFDSDLDTYKDELMNRINDRDFKGTDHETLQLDRASYETSFTP